MLIEAIRFATQAHKGQTRKYTNRPYIEHPLRVMGRAIEFGANDDEASAAVLHDVVEDCGISLEEIQKHFGLRVARLVEGLTNPSKGSTLPRAKRKEIDRTYLKSQPFECKIIKLIDRIDNIQEMTNADKKFIIKYCDESRLLAEVLKYASNSLYKELINSINLLESKVN